MIKLKPSDLGVTGKERTIKDHQTLVEKKLLSLKNKIAGSICKAIMSTQSGGKVPIDGLTPQDINEIKNYFAEVAAPILILNERSIPGIAPMSKVFYSTSDIERLFDFKLFINGKEILISNKQLKGGTNTLKPGDVIRLIDKDDFLKKKWKDTIYYKMFKILDENLVVSGPLKAVSELYPRKTKLKNSEYIWILNKLVKNDIIIKPEDKPPQTLVDMINSDPSTFQNYKDRGGITGTAINFLFEKILIAESKNDDKYNELFIDATSGNVLFFKFDLKNNGTVTYELVNPKKTTKKAILRSKQGVERRSSKGALRLDKLGFQP